MPHLWKEEHAEGQVQLMQGSETGEQKFNCIRTLASKGTQLHGPKQVPFWYLSFLVFPFQKDKNASF